MLKFVLLRHIAIPRAPFVDLRKLQNQNAKAAMMRPQIYTLKTTVLVKEVEI